MKPHDYIACIACAAFIALCTACGNNNVPANTVHVENLYDDTISTSYTVALPDDKGEGLRITYTFFNMKRADTGNFKMTHVYMRHTGEEDTTIVNGTWKVMKTDSGEYINAYSGRSMKRFYFINEGIEISTFNTDSLIADTGKIEFRQKVDNDLRNSTVKLSGLIVPYGNDGYAFVDMMDDTLPILKISAYTDLMAMKDSVDFHSEQHPIDLLGTIQIRMSMDGRSTQKSLIVEKVIGPR